MNNKAYLSLGSNIDKEKNMPRAIQMLARYGRVTAVSTIWETAPVGMADPATFFNAVVLLETEMGAEELKQHALKPIELELGRVRTCEKFTPRPMDIDIMLFNDEVIHMGNRNIPDKEIHERAFVAVPLAEIAPEYIHPVTGETIKEIADKFNISNGIMFPRKDIIIKIPV